MFLNEVQASRPHHESCKFVSQLVFSTIRTNVRDGPVDRISKVNLTLNGSLPSWRVRVFKISHVYVRARVEGVYHHLPVHRARYLYPSLSKVRRDRSNLPIGHPNFTCLVKKIGKCSVSQALMNKDSFLQYRVEAWRKFSDKFSYKS